MKLHEYQSKQIFSKYGVPIPKGRVATTASEARQIADELGGRVVVKSQVLVGGRGKAGGIKVANNSGEAEQLATQILAMEIKGLPVRKVLIDEAAAIDQEIYLGITNDRAARKPVQQLAVSRPECTMLRGVGQIGFSIVQWHGALILVVSAECLFAEIDLIEVIDDSCRFDQILLQRWTVFSGVRIIDHDPFTEIREMYPLAFQHQIMFRITPRQDHLGRCGANRLFDDEGWNLHHLGVSIDVCTAFFETIQGLFVFHIDTGLIEHFECTQVNLLDFVVGQDVQTQARLQL